MVDKIMLPEVFMQTKRLTLKNVRISQLDDMLNLDADPEVMRFITVGVPRTDPKHHLDAIPRLIKYAIENPGLGLWNTYMKNTNEYVGWYILKHLPETGEVEVGFRIHKKFWNQGLSTEIGKALIKHGFKTVGLERIIAIVRPDNFASQAVIKKIGLKEEGTGTFHDVHCLYFGLNRNEPLNAVAQ
ncbi:MAG: GNAT family N-acetyltransferase [Flavobacteriales bacterium]|nr:GNAT family N-acetyltransferase [Flavobacteriales bacterium]